MNFYFTFLVPNASRLELGLAEPVYSIFESRQANYVATEWENLCRKSVPMQAINGVDFDMAYRWWGTNLNNKPMEFDVVAESLDKKYILVGECKWSKVSDPETLLKTLEQKIKLFPLVKDKKVIPILFLKETPTKNTTTQIIYPADVLERTKL